MDRTNRQIPLPPEGWRRTNRWAGQLSLWAQQWTAIAGFGPKTPSPPFSVVFFSPTPEGDQKVFPPPARPSAHCSLKFASSSNWWLAGSAGAWAPVLPNPSLSSSSQARPTGVNFPAPSAARPSNELERRTARPPRRKRGGPDWPSSQREPQGRACAGHAPLKSTKKHFPASGRGKKNPKTTSQDRFLSSFVPSFFPFFLSFFFPPCNFP